MIQLIIGIIIGIFIATAGVNGVLKVVDAGVDAIKAEAVKVQTK